MPQQKKRKSYRQILAERIWTEDLDTTPMAAPVGADRPMTLQEEIQRFIKTEISQAAEDKQMETFEEADDFEEDDPDHVDLTPYNLTQLQEEEPLPLDVPEETTQAPQEADLPETDTSDPDADAVPPPPAQAPQETPKT